MTKTKKYDNITNCETQITKNNTNGIIGNEHYSKRIMTNEQHKKCCIFLLKIKGGTNGKRRKHTRKRKNRKTNQKILNTMYNIAISKLTIKHS